MVSNNLPDTKRHGIYYTPPHLAEFLAQPLVDRTDISVFDPAYGEGSLLLAAEKAMRHGGRSSACGRNLYGCDRAPVNGLLKHLPSSNLVEMDFVEYSPERKFDAILMNPPYVRHHLIDDAKRDVWQILVTKQCKLKLSSDLWAYFLIKATQHLKDGGCLGAILPWSLLQAEYARDVRTWLAEHFEKIRFLALNAEYFNEAQERVVLVWLENYGKPVRSIRCAFAQHITDNFRYSAINKAQWAEPTVQISDTIDIQATLNEYIEKYNFRRFGEIASVKIGVVTGADNFFILPYDVAMEYGFANKDLLPIFTSSKQLSGFHLNGHWPPKRLLKLNMSNSVKYKDYILAGVKEQYHLRAHSVGREPWFVVEVGQTPDAFFPYRATSFPYLILNDKRLQCTNSIHRIYFNGLSKNAIKWIQVSLLSVPGQLSLEAYSKVYGSGVLKTEPSSLKKALIYYSDSAEVDSVYDQVSELLANNNKFAAVSLATDFIKRTLQISPKLSSRALNTFLMLQQRRLDR